MPGCLPIRQNSPNLVRTMNLRPNWGLERQVHLWDMNPA